MAKRSKSTLSQQWERAIRAQEKALDRLIRTEAAVRKLRKRLARRSRKDAQAINTVEGWDQSPLSDNLTDISMGV